MKKLLTELNKKYGERIVQLNLLDETVRGIYETVLGLFEEGGGNLRFYYAEGVAGPEADTVGAEAAKNGVSGVIFGKGAGEGGDEGGVRRLDKSTLQVIKDYSFFIVAGGGLSYAAIHKPHRAESTSSLETGVAATTYICSDPEVVSFILDGVEKIAGIAESEGGAGLGGEVPGDAGESVRMAYGVVGKLDAIIRREKRRNFELSSLVSILKGNLGYHSKIEFLRQTGKLLVEITRAPIGFIQSLDPATKEATTMMLWRGYEIFLSGELGELPVEIRSYRHRLVDRKPFRFKLSEGDSPFVDTARYAKLGMRSGAAFPICADGVLIGAMTLLFGKKTELGSAEMRFYTEVAEAVSAGFRQRMLQDKVYHQAVTDGLTGLFNHRSFIGNLEIEKMRAERYQLPLSLMMIDIDNFKHYNDTNGHPAGDEVLRKVAAILRDSVRRTDYVARYGGEEFVALLPETRLENAVVVAEKVREAVLNAEFENERSQPGGSLTISIGVVELGKGSQSTTGLVKSADDALYRAKENGRNRVEKAG